MVARFACLASLVALALPSAALARGGSYAVVGGNAADRAQVRGALDASVFDWNAVPGLIQIHLLPGVSAYSTPGEIWLDPGLLRAGVFSWAVVQDEYAHQVDFFLLNDAEHDLLNAALGTRVWCHDDRPGLPHRDYGCERFTSTFVWAYWPSPQNAYKPASHGSEATMTPWRFRQLLGRMLAPSPAPLAGRDLFDTP